MVGSVSRRQLRRACPDVVIDHPLAGRTARLPSLLAGTDGFEKDWPANPKAILNQVAQAYVPGLL